MGGASSSNPQVKQHMDKLKISNQNFIVWNKIFIKSKNQFLRTLLVRMHLVFFMPDDLNFSNFLL